MQLLLEGWRGIGQSLAIVNQFQALAFLRRGDVNLYHRDLPTPMDWDAARNGSGLPPDDAAAISAIPTYDGAPVDAVYRIVAPSRSGASDDRRRTITFMVTELGLGPGSLAPEVDRAFFSRDANLIVTPTAWSATRLVEAGFDSERVRIVPHGVDRRLFSPLSTEEQAGVRTRLGFAPDETVLLNIGGPFWNKGADLLLEAFALLRARGRRVRLVLKDQSSLYGLGMPNMIAQIGARRPNLLADATLSAISLIPGSLDFAQLRELYGVADAYVSPYRAEGFNLPVLEAIACNVPVIVTSGGATDDFCPEPLAMRLPASPGAMDPEHGFPPRRFLQPSVDDLVDAMDRVCQGPSARAAATWSDARESVLQTFSWDRAATLLLDDAGLSGVVDQPAPTAEPIVVPSERPPQPQTEILTLKLDDPKTSSLLVLPGHAITPFHSVVTHSAKPSLSISCIETRDVAKAGEAIRRTIACQKFEVIYWFSNQDFPLRNIGVDVISIKIDAFSDKFADTTNICLNMIPRVVTTDFNLIVQADGFAVNAESWDDIFLEYDYVGAPWPWMWGGGPNWRGPIVGNGGFSLRSARLYKAILQEKLHRKLSAYACDERFMRREYYDIAGDHSKQIPEDINICLWSMEVLSEKYGIRFCPPDVANKFSIETPSEFGRYWLGKSFGFHGAIAAPYYSVTL